MTRPTLATRRFLWNALAIAGVTGTLACATNPVTGKKELSLMSESQEIAMGRQAPLK